VYDYPAYAGTHEQVLPTASRKRGTRGGYGKQ